MTPLKRELVERIRTDGPMRIDAYMALALSHPAHGYYATRDPFGARGDFVTAPEISQIFGELLGLWAATLWSAMGAPGRVALVELGPGRATLMADMLRAARVAPGFLEAVEVTLVETSPTLRRIQEERLAGAGAPLRWTASADEALTVRAPSPAARGAEKVRPLPAIVISNEFFDALPIRQFVRADRGWRETLVGVDGDRLVFGLSAEAPPDIDLPDAPAGSVREVSTEALRIAALVAGHSATAGGASLAVDYGYVSGFGDTLQAIARHAYVDPLDAPGDADLTAHVDFAALAAAANRAGAAVMKPLTQADFLERLGIAARAERLKAEAASAQSKAIAEAAARLTDRTPRGMGALFKALAFGDPRLGALPAFEPA